MTTYTYGPKRSDAPITLVDSSGDQWDIPTEAGDTFALVGDEGDGTYTLHLYRDGVVVAAFYGVQGWAIDPAEASDLPSAETETQPEFTYGDIVAVSDGASSPVRAVFTVNGPNAVIAGIQAEHPYPYSVKFENGDTFSVAGYEIRHAGATNSTGGDA
jgi:hypothetical protein